MIFDVVAPDIVDPDGVGKVPVSLQLTWDLSKDSKPRDNVNQDYTRKVTGNIHEDVTRLGGIRVTELDGLWTTRLDGL